MLGLESRDLSSISTRVGVIFCFKFYNPNVHNIARSGRIRFKMKNRMTLFIRCDFECIRYKGVCDVTHDWVPSLFCVMAM